MDSNNFCAIEATVMSCLWCGVHCLWRQVSSFSTLTPIQICPVTEVMISFQWNVENSKLNPRFGLKYSIPKSHIGLDMNYLQIKSFYKKVIQIHWEYEVAICAPSFWRFKAWLPTLICQMKVRVSLPSPLPRRSSALCTVQGLASHW